MARDPTPPARTQEDPELQTAVLEDLSGAVNYRRWLVDLAVPWLGTDVLEVGSGLGDYAADLADRGLHVTATEADATRLRQLRGRFGDDPRIRVRQLLAPVDEDAGHDAVVAFNVLEHIPDDAAALRSFARLVRPGGNVVMLVPAFPVAMSRFDRLVGHERRYRRASLARAFRRADLRLRELHYVNSLGLLAWLVGMRLLGMCPRDGVGLRIYDRLVIPLLRAAEQRAAPPFGQSLFAVGTPTQG